MDEEDLQAVKVIGVFEWTAAFEDETVECELGTVVPLTHRLLFSFFRSLYRCR